MKICNDILKLSVLFIFFTLLPTKSNGQWSAIGNTTPAFHVSSFAFQDNIYFAGGLRSLTGANDKIEIYNVVTGTLTAKTISVPRGGIMTAMLNGKIYFAGGYKFLGKPTSAEFYSIIDIFDTASNTWTTANLSTPRAYGAISVVNGKLLIAGGFTNVSEQIAPSNIVDIYNSTTGEWTVEKLTVSRGLLSGVSFGNKTYFCGGITDLATGQSSNRVDVYNASNNTWSIDSISLSRGATSIVGIDKYIIVAGGYNNASGALDNVDIFDTELNKWTTTRLSQPRSFMASAAHGQKAYFTGGGNNNTTSRFLSSSSNQVDIFDVKTGIWTTNSLVNSRVAHTCISLNNNIYVGGGFQPEKRNMTGVIETLKTNQ